MEMFTASHSFWGAPHQGGVYVPNRDINKWDVVNLLTGGEVRVRDLTGEMARAIHDVHTRGRPRSHRDAFDVARCVAEGWLDYDKDAATFTATEAGIANAQWFYDRCGWRWQPFIADQFADVDHEVCEELENWAKGRVDDD